jgi:excisionase family DNA binding protein
MNILLPREVAKLLRCDRNTVYRMLKQGVLPAFRIGSDWRISREELDQWMKDRSVLGK